MNQKYYEYVERQRQNYIDLTNDNNSIINITKLIFFDNKDKIVNILAAESMSIYDIFCMYLEISLRGLHILTDNLIDIFLLEDITDDLIFELKKYMQKLHINIEIKEGYETEIDSCFIQIIPNKTDNLFPYTFNETTTIYDKLENLKAYFRGKDKLFFVSFKYIYFII